MMKGLWDIAEAAKLIIAITAFRDILLRAKSRAQNDVEKQRSEARLRRIETLLEKIDGRF